jgi:hypothetical protein
VRVLVPAVDNCPQLSVARCLASQGVDLVTTSDVEVREGWSLGSRHLHVAFSPIQPFSSERDVLRMADLVKRQRLEVGIAATSCHQALLREVSSVYPFFRVAAPSNEQSAVLDSKVQSRLFFEGLGLPLPAGQTFLQSEVDRLRSFPRRYPLVLKRDLSSATDGVKVIRSDEELECAVSICLTLRQDFILEEYLGTTREYSHSFICLRSAYYPLFGLEKLAHFAPSHSTTIRFLSVREEERIIRVLTPLVEALSDGFYCAQLKVGPDGRLVLLEVSPRLGQNFRILRSFIPELPALLIALYLDPDAAVETLACVRQRRSEVEAKVGTAPLEEVLAAWLRLRFGSGSLLVRAVKEVRFWAELVARCRGIDDYSRALLDGDPFAAIHLRTLARRTFFDSEDLARKRSFIAR